MIFLTIFRCLQGVFLCLLSWAAVRLGYPPWCAQARGYLYLKGFFSVFKSCNGLKPIAIGSNILQIMKLLIFIGISLGVYWLIVKPFFLRAPKEKQPLQSAMETLFDAYNKGQTGQQPQNQGNNNDDDGEYTEYEEVK